MSWKRLFVGSVLLVFSMQVFAEEATDPGPPRGISLLTVNVNPGGAPPFEQFMAKYIEAANKVSSPVYWFASASAYGGPNNYSFARPFWSFAELADQSSPLAAAFGAEEAAKIGQAVSGSIASTSNEIYILRQDLSRPPAQSDTPPAALIVLLIDVKSDSYAAYENYVRKIVEASNKTNQGNWTAYAGGPGAVNDYVVGVPVTDWADLDNPAMPIPQRLTTAFGEKEGTRIFAEGGATIDNITTILRRTRPDLSRPRP